VAAARDCVSIAAMVAANLVPLALVLAGWANAPMLLLMYWGELVVIGIYAALRLLCAAGAVLKSRLYDAASFAFFYFLFCFPLAAFLATFYGIGWNQHVTNFPAEFWFSSAVFAATHGLDFVREFLLAGRRVDEDVEYGKWFRLFGLLFVAMAAAGIADEFRMAPAVAVLLVVLKTSVELALVLKARGRSAS
jgi:hypothetical protein